MLHRPRRTCGETSELLAREWPLLFDNATGYLPITSPSLVSGAPLTPHKLYLGTLVEERLSKLDRCIDTNARLWADCGQPVLDDNIAETMVSCRD